MRIISGIHKGRRIHPPKKLPVRPTTDMAKEGLFNVIGNHFNMEDIVVLDLFSGTGNISYEFVSRGSRSVMAVDINYPCVKFIEKTAGELNMTSLKAVRMNVFKFLETTHLTYDIIFSDPPYDMDGLEKIPEVVFSRQLLNKEGWLILEHSSKQEFTKHEHFLQLRRYGHVNFSVFG